MTHRAYGALGAILLAAVALLTGCGSKDLSGQLVEPLRPQIEISSGPITGTTTDYAVRINWFAYDADGQVVRYIYAVDPPSEGDTVWVSTRASEVTIFFRSPNPDDPLPPADRQVLSRGFHTFVIKAIDNEGLTSPPVSRTFTSRTVAPSTVITRPRPTQQQPTSTTPSITIDWLGFDPDGELTQKPVKYKFRIVAAEQINPVNPEGVTTGQIQEFFGRDAGTFFAQWDSVSGDTTSRFYEGLTPQTRYYFAIVAFDEAGAYEPRFNLNTNVLQFRPTLNKLGPRITVFNEFFSRTQTTGGVSLAPSRIFRLEFPSNSQVVFNWSAEPPVGALITGYRWALDIQDIEDESPRRDDADLNHWSSWSLAETNARIGPFTGSLDSTVTHFFYIEARDNLGFVSLFTIQLRIVEPRFDRPLLVVDDMYGTATERNVRYVGGYPMEAEQDTFYYAIGGVPDSMRIKAENTPGLLSDRGMFADFEFDTLDYRFYPNEGILLSDLARYRVVTWYTDNTSAGRSSPKFGSLNPSTAIRTINAVNQLNTLAVYLRQFGKVWLFGDGTTQAIANGFWTKVASGAPTLPYTAGDTRNDILKLGNFLHDFCRLRSEVNTAGTATTSLSFRQQLQSAIPYLPQFQCTSEPPVANRTCDPRIGPSAARNVARWGQLPQLTLRSYRGALVDPTIRSIYPSMVITKPLFMTEGSGASFRSVLDTLYVLGAREYDPNRIQIPPSDGFPNGVHYSGSEHGAVVWFGFPMHFFERDQARLCTRIVLTNLGLTPAAPGQPRGAHPFVSTTAPRILADGGTVETPTLRRAGR